MRRQLALGAAAVTTTVALAFLVPLALMVRTVVEERALSRADLTARSLAPVVAVTDDPDLIEDAVGALSRRETQIAVDLAGRALIGTPAPQRAALEVARAGRAFVSRTEVGATVLVPVEGAGTEPTVISVFVPADELRRGVGRAWWLLALLGTLLVAVAVGLADRLARTVVGPVRALAETSRRLGRGDLEARVEPSGPPEVAEVGRVTNQLAGRIGELLVKERELVADLSHRLRTPLASLRLDAEQLPDSEASERVREDIDLLERGLTDLIHEARRTPAGPPPVIDLAELVRDRAGFWAALAEEQARPWEVLAPPGPVPVAVDPHDAEAALDGVLGNVFAHTPDRAGCRIELVASAQDARVVVSDEGPGFPPGPLRRGRSEAGSTGLGLDIARRVAESAGGELHLRNGTNGGACVELFLPLAEFTPA